MKNTADRTLKTLITKQLLIETGIVLVVLALIGFIALQVSNAAFWNHTTL